jgi:hypothetical protein
MNALNGNIVTDNGLFTEDDIDVALLRIFTARMQTGEFDPVEDVPYKRITKDVLQSEAHLELARQSAREGLILLENKNNFLPLDQNSLGSIAVYGTLARVCELGDYSADLRDMDRLVTFQDGLTEHLKDTGITLNFYDGIDLATVGAVPEWLCNLRQIRFNRAEAETVNAVTASELSGRIENENNNQLGYIKENDWAMFSNVPLAGLRSIEVLTSSESGAGTTDISIEVRLGSPNGPVVARPVHQHTGGGWNDYNWSEPAPVQVPNDFSIETTPAADLYFVFTCPVNAELRQNELAHAAAADVAIVYVGTTTEKTIEYYRDRPASDGGRIDIGAFMVCAEFTDRASLRLPAGQEDLINAVLERNPNTIVVMHTVSTNDIRSFKDKAPAILYSSYNGQFQGQAAAEVIFGAHNPGGRLTTTWVESEQQLPYIGDYTIRKEDNGIGRTYMFFDGAYDYPFGYGLTYTTFSHSNVRLDQTTVPADGVFTVSVDVTNTGPVKGTDIVQVYITTPDAGTKGVPQKMLRGFGRVELEPGEMKTLAIEMDAGSFGMVLEDYGPRAVTPGDYTVTVARNADDPISTETVTVTRTAPKLHTVTLEAGRVVTSAGRSFDSALTVVLSDESFVDTAPVTYRSGNSAVAAVDRNGRVTAVGGGLTTITAAVTYDGMTKEASFPIVVDISDRHDFLNATVNILDLIRDSLNLPVELNDYGVYIERFGSGGLLSAIGMRQNDVIAKINGYAVTGGARLQEIYAAMPDGTDVFLKVWRESQYLRFGFKKGEADGIRVVPGPIMAVDYDSSNSNTIQQNDGAVTHIPGGCQLRYNNIYFAAQPDSVTVSGAISGGGAGEQASATGNITVKAVAPGGDADDAQIIAVVPVTGSDWDAYTDSTVELSAALTGLYDVILEYDRGVNTRTVTFHAPDPEPVLYLDLERPDGSIHLLELFYLWQVLMTAGLYTEDDLRQVPEADAARFKEKLADAQAMYVNHSATQLQINEAESALADAMKDFGEPSGTGQTPDAAEADPGFPWTVVLVIAVLIAAAAGAAFFFLKKRSIRAS